MQIATHLMICTNSATMHYVFDHAEMVAIDLVGSDLKNGWVLDQ